MRGCSTEYNGGMNINIKATGITLTEAISDYVAKRMQSVEKLFENDSTAQCDIELAKVSNHHKQGEIFSAEIHIVAKEKNLFARVSKEDLYAAIDAVRDDILRESKNSKDKKISRMRRGGAYIKNIVRGIIPGKWNRE